MTDKSKEYVKINNNILDVKSKKKYLLVYKQFLNWCEKNNIESYTDKVILNYFHELSKKYKSSSLWAHYSMLRTTISLNHQIDIAEYYGVRSFLRCKSINYQPKRSNVFTTEQINKFINEAPDYDYLLLKVALIMGVYGACAREELHNMKITDVTDYGTAALIQIPKTKTKSSRKFMITDTYYNIFKKYTSLRPENIYDKSLFVNYDKGKCFIQKVGINKLGKMGNRIASYLKLDNPELYTGHCFRRSGNMLLTDCIKSKRKYRSNKSIMNELSEKQLEFDYNIKEMNENNLDLTENIKDIKVEEDNDITLIDECPINDIDIKIEMNDNNNNNDDDDDVPPVINTNLQNRSIPSNENNKTNMKDNDDENVDDHFTIFGKYIASRLRRLNNNRLQAICQHRINKLIFDFEMSNE